MIPKCNLYWEAWTLLTFLSACRSSSIKWGGGQKSPHRVGTNTKGDNTPQAPGPLCQTSCKCPGHDSYHCPKAGLLVALLSPKWFGYYLLHPTFHHLIKHHFTFLHNPFMCVQLDCNPQRARTTSPLSLEGPSAPDMEPVSTLNKYLRNERKGSAKM